MELYNLLKIFHVVCALVLFGTPLAYAWYNFCVRHENNLAHLYHAKKINLKINIILVGVFGILQPVSGFAMLFTRIDRFSPAWISAAIAAYAFAALFWLILIFLQARSLEELKLAIESNITTYQNYATWRIVFGSLALFSVIMAVYVMTSKI